MSVSYAARSKSPLQLPEYPDQRLPVWEGVGVSGVVDVDKKMVVINGRVVSWTRRGETRPGSGSVA